MIRSVNDMAPGMRFRYLGDDKSYHSRFLKEKGARKGTYLLPHFYDREDGMRDWTEEAGALDREYEVIGIERGRFDKRGKALPPLILLQMVDKMDSGWKIGLRLEDFNRKFRASGDDEGIHDDMELSPEPVDISAAIAANPMWGAF